MRNDISSEGNTTTLINRYVNTSNTLYLHHITMTKPLGQNVGTQILKGFRTCEIMEKLDGFTHKDNTYTGDIIKVFCTVDGNLTTTIKDQFIDTFTKQIQVLLLK